MPTSPVIAVVGASGGLGASTVALAVGRRLSATGPPAVVVDLDLEAGGLDVSAGVEHLPGRRWPAFAGVRGHVPAEPLLASLPADDGCRLLSAGGPSRTGVPPDAVADVLLALVDSGGPVVLDAPPRSPHLPRAVGHATLVLVVAGLWTRALADAGACVERLLDDDEPGTASADLRLVTRGPRPTAAVLDDVEAHLGIAHLHHLLDDPAVARDGERGMWPGTSRDAVRRCADAVVEAAAAGPASAWHAS